MKRYIPIVAMLFLAACGDDSSSGEPVTYTKDIQPLLAQNCVACHTEGGPGPFVVKSYDEAKSHAAAMADATMARRMPPDHADNSGACNTFHGSRWLEDEETALISKWIADGLQEGDLSVAESPARLLPELSGTVVSTTMSEDYTPDTALTDDYRCFLVDSPGANVVTGYNVVPGNTKIVHHVIAYQVTSMAAANQALMKDAETIEPGYPCLNTGGPGVDAIGIAGWAPGAGASVFPGDVGFEIDGDLPMILEIHYNVAGGPGESDRTGIEFQTSTGPFTQLESIELANFLFTAPPGLASFNTSEDFSVSVYAPQITGRMKVLSVDPHMHLIGQSVRVEKVKANGDIECLFDMPAWDFNWQLSYWYENEVYLEPGDVIRMSCEFDTSSRTQSTGWGDGTEDEMCLVYLNGILVP